MTLLATATFAVVDPATLEVIDEVAEGTPDDARAAVDAAAAAFPAWSRATPRDRAETLRRAFDLMVARTDELAALICAENGKSQADARAEVAYAAEFFRWFSEEAVRSDGDYSIAPSSGARTIVTHQPVGVAALVTPWNFPAAMATRKIAPALAAGCTVVLKPAASAGAILRVAIAAGKFHGVTSAATPTGRCVTSVRVPPAGASPYSPPGRTASSENHRKNSAA